MEWVKLSSRGILRGTLSQSRDVVQLVWIKLLCFMGETKFRNGRFEYGKGRPYTMDFLATNCGITLTIFEGCIEEYKEDINPDTGEPRVRVEKDGTLVLVNWERYQEKPEKVKAKEEALAKAKETKQMRENRDDMILRTLNELNRKVGSQRYELTPDGKQILDKTTGEIRDIDEVKQ